MIKKLLLLPAVALMGTVSATALADSPSDWMRADLDRDGVITQREAMRYARSTFAERDRNRDGVLSPYELRTAGFDFRREDVNRDGRVSYFEHQAAARSDFARYDFNHDGVIRGYELRGRGRYGSYR
jgi:Ca2+-binding EF-hand superfamily protein